MRVTSSGVGDHFVVGFSSSEGRKEGTFFSLSDTQFSAGDFCLFHPEPHASDLQLKKKTEHKVKAAAKR